MMSCLFVSFSGVLNKPHEDLRTQVCDFIELNNPAVFDNFSLKEWVFVDSGLDVHKYAERMRMTSTWGGAIELFCLAVLHNLSIFVHISGTLHHVVGSGHTTVNLMYTGTQYS